MYVVVSVLIIIVAIVLILIILVQNSKGGGLDPTFANSNQFMGVNKTNNFLEKATWGLAIALVVLSLLATVSIDNKKVSGESLIKEQVEGTNIPMPVVPPKETNKEAQPKAE